MKSSHLSGKAAGALLNAIAKAASMKITLTNAGKRFNRDWIFRNINYEFQSPLAYAIIGPNGSGKSTLLQIIGGAVGLSEGNIDYSMTDGRWSMVGEKGASNEKIYEYSTRDNSRASAQPPSVISHRPSASAYEPSSGHRASTIDHRVPAENIFQSLSLAAPYLELIEEMTLKEFLEFHNRFKPLLEEISIQKIIDSVQLGPAANKQIRYFSSGMKQRIKLAQAIFSRTPLLLLDEPCTNLDEDGISIYLKLIERYGEDRLIIVSSNDRQEYSFCKQTLDLRNYK
jgi:ABC-type multidrug transport system ATPase subunit